MNMSEQPTGAASEAALEIERCRNWLNEIPPKDTPDRQQMTNLVSDEITNIMEGIQQGIVAEFGERRREHTNEQKRLIFQLAEAATEAGMNAAEVLIEHGPPYSPEDQAAEGIVPVFERALGICLSISAKTFEAMHEAMQKDLAHQPEQAGRSETLRDMNRIALEVLQGTAATEAGK